MNAGSARKPTPLPEVQANNAWREGWFQGIVVGFIIGFGLAVAAFVR